MFLEVIQWGGAMFLVIGAIILLWVITDRIAEKKYRISERLETLERWKAGIELADAQAARESQNRILAEQHAVEADKAEFRRQNELAALLHKDDEFDQEYRGLLNGN